MADLARIKRNVAKMAGMNAPEADIDGYIASEGVTVDDVRNFKPQAQSAVPQSLGDQLSAGFTSGVNAIPIAGPTILGGLERLKASVQGRPYEDVAATDKAQTEANPVASTTGSVAGTVLPFMLGGAIPGVARVLGMSGGIGSRIGFGALSGAGIGAADTGVRGGSGQDIANSAVMGGALGGVLPVAEKAIGAGFNALTGRTVSKDARNVARALSDDQIPVDEINSRLAKMGDGAMVMDLGPNLQRQAGAVASVPGPGQKLVRDAVAERGKGATERVNRDVAATLGTGPELSAMADQVVTAQKAAAGPLYDAVRDVKVPLLQGNFNFVFSTPMGKQALATAREMAANDGYKGVDTIQIIDYAKQALDDIAIKAGRAGEGNKARQAGNLARTLAGEADKVAPGYKAAREAYAGPAKVLDALDAGSAVFSKEMSPGQLMNSLSSMSQSERDAFIQAARASVEASMGNAVNDALALRNLFKKGYNEAKLKLIVGADVADDLLKRIEREATFGQTANAVVGNSETAARQAAQAEVAPELGRTPRPDGLVGLLFQAFDGARNRLSGVRQPKINKNMAATHTAPQLSPAQLRALSLAAIPKGNALLGPAAAGLLTGPDKPLQITIHGGR